MIKRLLAYPLTRLRRARVSRGFSVHSPFAYRFITWVLRERLPYYCFDTQVTTPERQRLFRVVNFVAPSTFALVDDCPEARRIILLAAPRSREVSDPSAADFTYSLDLIPTDFRALYVERTGERPPQAMVFTNGHCMIAFRHRPLPSQTFTLSF